MSILGLILLAVAALLFIVSASHKRKLGLIRLTETSTIAELRALAETGDEHALHTPVEVKGTVVCDEPLLAELSETACVYYAMKVEWEFEEIFYEDDERTKVSHSREGSEVLAQEKRLAPFWVEDYTGRILVDPEGAEIIAEKTLSRIETDEGAPDSVITMGAFAMDAPWLTSLEERQPREYHFEEEAIPLGVEVYVLGEAAMRNGELVIQKSARGGKFLISVKQEEELMSGAKQSMLMWRLGAWLCGLLGLAAIFFGSTCFS